MAATTSGALKQLIEGAGLSLDVYQDRAPQTDPPVKPPYVTITEEIALVPDRLEDGGPAQTVGAGSEAETAQVDLWQQWKNPATSGTGAGQITEDRLLPKKLRRVLHGADLGAIGTPAQRVYACLVRNSVRLLEQDENLVHHALTLEIRRQM